jgi:hypothetical protein
MRWPGE